MTNGELTEFERIKMENYALKHNLLQQQIQQNMAQRAQCIREIEADHPGYVWDEQRGLVQDSHDKSTVA